jgi:hypothetical protein
MPDRIKREEGGRIKTEDGDYLMQEGGTPFVGRSRKSKFAAQYQYFYQRDKKKWRKK